MNKTLKLFSLLIDLGKKTRSFYGSDGKIFEKLAIEIVEPYQRVIPTRMISEELRLSPGTYPWLFPPT